MSDDLFDRALTAGAARLDRVFAEEAPCLAPAVAAAIAGLTPSGRVADYFSHPNRFPVLRLPWWAVADVASGDERLCRDVLYGTMAGYLFVRLIDDLVDRDPAASNALLPAVAVLHTEFQSAFQPHFPAEAPFWPLFRRRWYRLADAMIAVVGPDEAPAALERRAERTIGAVAIPLAALTQGLGVPERFSIWEPVVAGLARLEQWIDDVVDWQADLDRGLPNMVLAAAAGRARPGEPVAAWMIREGYRWGLGEARDRIDALAPLTAPGGEAVAAFLAGRRAAVDRYEAAAGPGLAALAALGRAFGAGSA